MEFLDNVENWSTGDWSIAVFVIAFGVGVILAIIFGIREGISMNRPQTTYTPAPPAPKPRRVPPPAPAVPPSVTAPSEPEVPAAESAPAPKVTGGEDGDSEILDEADDEAGGREEPPTDAEARQGESAST